MLYSIVSYLCCEIAPSTPVIKYDSIFVERIFHALHALHVVHAM